MGLNDICKVFTAFPERDFGKVFDRFAQNYISGASGDKKPELIAIFYIALKDDVIQLCKPYGYASDDVEVVRLSMIKAIEENLNNLHKIEAHFKDILEALNAV